MLHTHALISAPPRNHSPAAKWAADRSAAGSPTAKGASNVARARNRLGGPPFKPADKQTFGGLLVWQTTVAQPSALSVEHPSPPNVAHHREESLRAERKEHAMMCARRANVLWRVCALLLLTMFQGAQAVTPVTCAPEGCTYESVCGSGSYDPSRKTLDCDGKNIEGALHITDYPSDLETLDLDTNELTSLSPNEFDHLANLTTLHLSYNKLTSLSPDQFDHLANLTTLHLSYNKLTSLSPDQFDHLANLTELSLSYNKLTSLSPDQFAHNPELTELSLNDNELTSLSADQFAHNPDLSYLSLKYNKLTSLSADQFAHNPDLSYLSLKYNKLTSLSPDQFAHNPELTELSLSYNNLTSLSPNQFSHNPKLTILPDNNNPWDANTWMHYGCYFNNEVLLMHCQIESDMADWDMADWGAFHITNYPSGLKSFTLRRSRFTSIHEHEFDQLANLTSLSFEDNLLTSLSADQFAHNPKLKYLDLTPNLLTSLSADQFAHNPELTELSLSYNKLTSLSPDQFAHNPKLESLSLKGNKLNTLSKRVFENLLSLTHFSVDGVLTPTCPSNHFKYPFTIAGQTIYTCDPCHMPNESRAISCWRGERTDYVDHHPPRLCPRGMYCVNGSEYDCEAGKYSPVLGIGSKSNCSDCLAGMYNPIPSQPFCPFSCPPGKYSDEIGAKDDTCVECEAGKFCHGGMQEPQDCPAGTYRSSTGGETVSSCEKCGINQYSRDIGANSSTACERCPGGRFSAAGSSDESQCTKTQSGCAAGEGMRNGECRTCPPGTRSHKGGCALCPIGRFQNEHGKEVCKECDTVICTSMTGSTSNDAAALPKEVGKKSVSDAKATSTLGVSDYALYTYVAFASTSAMVLIVHRRCPIGFKSIDFFADKHKIEDTFALRYLETRIGAAFTVVLLMAVAGILVMITDPRNNQMSTGGIVPITPVMRSDSGYGTISLSLIPFAPAPDPKCDDIEVSVSSALGCTTTIKSPAASKATTACKIALTCEVKSTAKGVEQIGFEFPERFQWVAWELSASQWTDEADFAPETFSGVLTANQSDAFMTGTKLAPSTVMFGGLLSRFKNALRNETMYGMQLLPRGENIQESNTQLVEASHWVVFEWSIAESMYNSERRRKYDSTSLVSQVIAYALSVISMLSVSKKYVQVFVDRLVSYRARSTESPVPADVKERQRILNEETLRDVKRRVSLVARMSPTHAGETDELGIEMTNPMAEKRSHGANLKEQLKIQSAKVDALEKKVAKVDALEKKVAKMERLIAALEQRLVEKAPAEKALELHTDPETGRQYWYNRSTNETRWVATNEKQTFL